MDEPGLADPGNTDDRDELGRALIADAPEDRAQQLDLAVAADQRRVGTSGNVEAVPGDRLERFPDCDRVRLSLRRNSRSLAVADRIARGPTRRLPDKNAVDRRGRLQPCGSVDHVPRDHGLPFGRSRANLHQRLARVHSDAHLQIRLLNAPVADRKRRTHRPLRIVFVGNRRAENGHHCVADELLHRAASPLELRAQVSVIRLEQSAHVLGIEEFRLCREADEVDEHDRDDLAFFAERALLSLERTTAGVAEACAFRILLATAGARHHAQSVRRARSVVTSAGPNS